MGNSDSKTRRQLQELQRQLNSIQNDIHKQNGQIDQCRKKSEAIMKDIEAFNDTGNYIQKEKFYFDKFISLLKTYDFSPIRDKHWNNMGVIGSVSTGKSMFVNALLGKKVCKTGQGAVTKEMKKAGSLNHIHIYDVPGCDKDFDYYNYKVIEAICKMEVIVIMYENDLNDKSVSNFMRIIEAVGVQYVVVRNKADQFADTKEESIREYKRIKKSQQELLNKICETHPQLFVLSAYNSFKYRSSKEKLEPYELFDWKDFSIHLMSLFKQ